ncbi:drug:proton antiporter [Xylophilus rhododendri]|uniref:Drug:proton antiporter n=1 Tax=Xylophilus rhododendri TaxID=2697032 RepID=A0A857JF04_9BURK|nr:VOC family protein [Xylophilus rhododendri]QHJ01266.1 drug:proton antiporter [Xylophilus rhododendri]
MDASFILYVSDLERSSRFYAELLGQQPVPFEATFVMFFQESGARLGLAQRDSIASAGALPSSGFELDFPVSTHGDVDRMHADWVRRGLAIVEPPNHMAFAYTFVAADPDGHRLRFYCRRVSGGY